MRAVAQGHVELASVCLGSGADIVTRDVHGRNISYHTISEGLIDIVRMLLNRACSSSAIDEAGREINAFGRALTLYCQEIYWAVHPH